MTTEHRDGKYVEVTDFTREKQTNADVKIRGGDFSGHIHGNRKGPSCSNQI